ncbi:MAG: O-methyltransferase [Alphaproteobacteria bacterium]|nr:O-methyltransferase [Alphaproteobacteria bacterium]
MKTRTEGKLAEYLSSTFVGNDPFAHVRAEGETRHPGMQVSPYEAHLLAWLVTISGAKRILEVGTFMGYSTLYMASAMPKNGSVITLEKSEENAKIAAAHVAQDKRIEVVCTDALAWIQNYSGAPFDMIFLDAEKRQYPAYLEAALSHLSPNAWVLADNSLLWGAVSGDDPKAASKEATEAMRAFNALLADKTKFDGVLLTTPEGLTVARRR